MNPETIPVSGIRKSAPIGAGQCGYVWGNCDPADVRYFGKPSQTPHACKGERRHSSKMHVCAKCGGFGAVVMPLPFTKAGRDCAALDKAQQILIRQDECRAEQRG